MILQASQRIAAPQAFVFARALEIDRLLRAAEARGAEVDPPERDGARLRCALRYPVRGQAVPLVLSLEPVAEAGTVTLEVAARAVVAEGRLWFAAAGAEATDMALRAELRPLGLQGRVLLGSLRMAQGQVQARLERDLAALARGAEALWRGDAA